MNLAYENVKEVDCLDISREGCDAWEAAVRRYEDRIGKLLTNSELKSIVLLLLYPLINKSKKSTAGHGPSAKTPQ